MLTRDDPGFHAEIGPGPLADTADISRGGPIVSIGGAHPSKSEAGRVSRRQASWKTCKEIQVLKHAIMNTVQVPWTLISGIFIFWA